MDGNRSSAVQNFDALREQCKELGLFDRSQKDIFAELSIVVAMWAVALLIRPEAPVTAFTLAVIASITLVWWIHDSGHDAFFKTRKTSQWLIEAAGVIFLGMPQIEYHYEVHRIHHAHTNIIGKDGALQTGPVRWHEKQLRSAQDKFSSAQAFLWFCVALPLVWPLVNTRCVKALVERKKWARISFIAARWVLVLWYFRNDLTLVFVPQLIAGFILGFFSSLNHFHLPMDDKKQDAFPSNVFITTQNLAQHGLFATWISGGLNFHIEHHLFPTMPSKNLKYAAPLVEKYARQNGLPYNICDSTEAVLKLYNHLQNPDSHKLVKINEGVA